MRKSSKSLGKSLPKTEKGYPYPCPPGDMRFNDRPLMGVNPLKQQFEPTPASAIRQHHRMAGYE